MALAIRALEDQQAAAPCPPPIADRRAACLSAYGRQREGSDAARERVGRRGHVKPAEQAHVFICSFAVTTDKFA